MRESERKIYERADRRTQCGAGGISLRQRGGQAVFAGWMPGRPVQIIAREARKHDTIINYVAKERLDQLSETGAHQG